MNAYDELMEKYGHTQIKDIPALERIIVAPSQTFAQRNAAATELSALRQRIAELEGERDALRGLATYARHSWNCSDPYARNCPCGYADARRRLTDVLEQNGKDARAALER